jgi:hypothetical protein
MSGTLKRRIRAHAREHRDDAKFAERLLKLADRIDREFAGEQREQLISLAEDAFERHLRMRRESMLARERLAALSSDQRRLLELLDFLSTGLGDARLH